LTTTWPEHRGALRSATSSGPWERAERERAAVDEPVVGADVRADLKAAAAIEKAEGDQDADFEI
jgi:hypothetical protein